MSTDTAIFIDLDNIAIGATEVNLSLDMGVILQHVRKITNDSRVVIRRAYGDWRQNGQVPRNLAVNGFELQSVVRLNHNDKNLADIQMVLDAAETIIDCATIQNYVLVTGDRDFMPLVQMLRRRGKNVIGMGIRHTTSNSLVDLCDQYVFYDDLTQSAIVDDKKLLATWITKTAKKVFVNEDKVQASVFREQLQKASADKFSSTQFARSGFSKLLSKFPEIVKLEWIDTTLYVAPAQAQQPKAIVAKLATKYKSELKKRGLRVIPARMRLLVLKDLVGFLQRTSAPRWHEVVDFLSQHYTTSEHEVSRSMINDILRLVRRAKIIEIDERPDQPLSMTQIKLKRDDSKAYLNAVVLSDKIYLAELKKIEDLRFDWHEAAIALYDSAERISYLQMIHQNGSK